MERPEMEGTRSWSMAGAGRMGFYLEDESLHGAPFGFCGDGWGDAKKDVPYSALPAEGGDDGLVRMGTSLRSFVDDSEYEPLPQRGPFAGSHYLPTSYASHALPLPHAQPGSLTTPSAAQAHAGPLLQVSAPGQPPSKATASMWDAAVWNASRTYQPVPADPFMVVGAGGPGAGGAGGRMEALKMAVRAEQDAQPPGRMGARNKRVAMMSPISLVVERQPPMEIRTRTPTENRTFSFVVRLAGPFEPWRVHSVEAQLRYADEAIREDLSAILGGRRRVLVLGDVAAFEAMSLCEASTKHAEREFCIVVVPYTVDNEPLPEFAVRTRPIYAFSHNKILHRRKFVQIVCASRSFATASGGNRLHVIGGLFLSSPMLSVRILLPSGEALECTALDPHTDRVLFFTTPPYPYPIPGPHGAHVAAQLVVTNDGRSFSTPIPFFILRDADVQFIPGL